MLSAMIMVRVLTSSKPHGAMRERPQPAIKPDMTIDTARMLHLIQAAEKIFLEKGFHSATMNDVAKAAGMSKKTVYKLIDSKTSLFIALVEYHQQKLVIPVMQDGWAVSEILVQTLLNLGQYLLSPRIISVVRMIMAEQTHSVDFGRDIHQKRVLKGKILLENCILQHTSVKPAEVREMATLLFGMALGDFYLAVLVGFRLAPGKAALTRRIRLAVDLFLAAIEKLNA